MSFITDMQDFNNEVKRKVENRIVSVYKALKEKNVELSYESMAKQAAEIAFSLVALELAKKRTSDEALVKSLDYILDGRIASEMTVDDIRRLSQES